MENTGRRDGRVMTPFLDWSFKYLFGTEESKANLIGLLNLIIMPDVPIVDLTYLNNEVLPVALELKGCVFDIICEDENGERYLDTMSCLEMAEERGVKNVAKSMKTDGVDYAVISKYTNLTIAEIDKL